MVRFMRWDNLRLDEQPAADQDTAGETLFPPGAGTRRSR